MKEKLDNAHSILHSILIQEVDFDFEDPIAELYFEEIEQAINHIKSTKQYLIEIS